MFYFDEYDSPVGMLTIASDGQAVCGLWLDGQKYHGATIPEEMTRKSDADGFAELRAWLDAYFVGDPQPIESVPLQPIPISIIIPCHRVVGSDGSLTGYAGGIPRKLWLLEHEGVDTGRLYVPKRGTAL